ncbi:hypothetical protein EBL84_08790 [Marichromatium sp. AB31]|nr:hypothetical protein [Marichromatium gracile]RNE90067.1 hypothetical protein EBL84_08790 [Marichromatium sp. AB31]
MPGADRHRGTPAGVASTSATPSSIDAFYRRKRLHSTLGDRCLVEFMQHWQASQSHDQTTA